MRRMASTLAPRKRSRAQKTGRGSSRLARPPGDAKLKRPSDIGRAWRLLAVNPAVVPQTHAPPLTRGASRYAVGDGAQRREAIMGCCFRRCGVAEADRTSKGPSSTSCGRTPSARLSFSRGRPVGVRSWRGRLIGVIVERRDVVGPLRSLLASSRSQLRVFFFRENFV